MYVLAISVFPFRSMLMEQMGNYVGFSWAALVYPPLRWLELRKLGR